MARWLSMLAFGGFCSLVTLAASGALSSKPQTVATTTVVATREPGLRVHVGEEFEQRFGVRTTRVTTRSLAPLVSLVGTLNFHSDHMADIGVRVRGRVTRVLVHLGEHVHAGQPLLELDSTEVGAVEATRRSALAVASVARARLARETHLLEQRLTTAAAVEEARAELARAQADAMGASQRLASMGAGSGHIVLRSPLDGRVVQRHVNAGQVLDDTHTALRIADPTKLRAELEVFEQDIARIRVGDPVELRAEAWPNRTFTSTVRHLEEVLDPHTRSAGLLADIDNPDGALRAGMFVTARVRATSLGTRPVIAIPRGALVQVEGRPTAFVRRGASTYEAIALSLGSSSGDDVEVERGLREGDEVVVEGAFALKSEMLR